MNKELEALLILAAKATGRGVYGVNPDRAAEFGVEVAILVRKGETLPGWYLRCETNGYYTPSGRPALVIDRSSPGDGWTRHSIAELRSDSTGHYRFGFAGLMTQAECKLYLRGVAEGAERRLT
jgi:hypothetical protein